MVELPEVFGKELAERRETGYRVCYYGSMVEWWADARNQAPDYCLGGTSCSAIMGVGYSSPWDIWRQAAERQRAYVPAEPGTPMKRGNDWEPRILAAYEAKAGCKVLSPKCRIELPCDSPYSFLRPSPDGFVVEGGKIVGLVEAKSSYTEDGWGDDGEEIYQVKLEPEANPAPLGYLVQVLINLEISGLPYCDLVLGTLDYMSWELRMKVIRVHAQPEIQKGICEAIKGWRQTHLIDGAEPELDSSDACNHHLALRKADGRVGLEPKLAKAVSGYLDRKEAIETLEGEKRTASHEIIDLLGDAKGGKGHGVSVTRVVRSGSESVSLAKIKAEAPDIYEELKGKGLLSRGNKSTHIRAKRVKE